ncbi:MAG: MotA/TolQ/ExbB proton channel family protein [Spirochaetes bacterium]|nr:MotA/TolQ/ExbB proton channel family protein [Spirochaetota bacterium]
MKKIFVICTLLCSQPLFAQELSPNSSSLWTTFKQGGILMWPILFLGIVGLTIIIERSLFYLKIKIWDTAHIEDKINALLNQNIYKFREEAIDDLEKNIQLYYNQLEKGLVLLNAVGNLSPIIGFFGTVQGMIAAFASIAAATTVNAKVVAVGIQIALITTAGGLSIAVPTLAFYHFFIHILQNVYTKASELIIQKTKQLPRYSQIENHTTLEGV